MAWALAYLGTLAAAYFGVRLWLGERRKPNVEAMAKEAENQAAMALRLVTDHATALAELQETVSTLSLAQGLKPKEGRR